MSGHGKDGEGLGKGEQNDTVRCYPTTFKEQQSQLFVVWHKEVK